MFLLIKNPNNIDLSSFCEYLCTKFIRYSKSDSWYTPELTALWDNYFTELYKEKESRPTVRLVFQAYFSNLSCKTVADGVVIVSNKNYKLPGINELVVDLAKIINYGTLEMPKYPLFDKLFDFVADNIDNEYSAWEVSTNVS